jgi:hypothetical protein
MIRTEDGKRLVTQVDETFWPVFLTGKLVVRFVKQAICFCLNDKAAAKQLILVFPDKTASCIPTLQDLSKVFALNNKGKPFRDVRDIPVPVLELKELPGVFIEDVTLPDRHLTVLYAVRDPGHDENVSDSVLAGLQLEMDPMDHKLWPAKLDDYYVLQYYHHKFHGVYNLIMLIKQGAQVERTSCLAISSFVTGDILEAFQRKLEYPPLDPDQVVYH